MKLNIKVEITTGSGSVIEPTSKQTTDIKNYIEAVVTGAAAEGFKMRPVGIVRKVFPLGRPKWTPEQDEILLNSDMSTAAARNRVAQQIGHTSNACYQRRYFLKAQQKELMQTNVQL